MAEYVCKIADSTGRVFEQVETALSEKARAIGARADVGDSAIRQRERPEKRLRQGHFSYPRLRKIRANSLHLPLLPQ